jgi:hypothetical protein
MENLIKKHIDKFNKEPLIIGLFWDDIKKLSENIYKAIEDNKPYNEYEILTKEEKKAFDKGELLF